MTEPHLWAADDLSEFVLRVCAAVGMPDPDARLFASALVEADLRGVGSHGCMRLPAYARALATGVVNPRPGPTRVRGGSAVEVLDGDNGIGLVLGQVAMHRAVELARASGIGAVAVRNSNHTGMLAALLSAALNANMIGYFTSNAPAIMAPWGGMDPRLGNGPFTYGIPVKAGDPIVLDMASSATNRGRVRQYAQRGQELPPGWALDAGGAPTTDPAQALQGVVLPVGGHKGYGLAVVNEILAGVLPGAALAVQMPRAFLREGSRVLDSWKSGHLAVALDIAAFADVDEFAEQVDMLIAEIRSSRLAPGSEEILLPGELEWTRRAEQLRNGIRLERRVTDALHELAGELGVAPLRP